MVPVLINYNLIPFLLILMLKLSCLASGSPFKPIFASSRLVSSSWLSTSMLSGIVRCSRLILCILRPILESAISLRSAGSFLWEMFLRNQDLSARYFLCHWGTVASGLLSGERCMYIHRYAHIYIYTANTMSSLKPPFPIPTPNRLPYLWLFFKSEELASLTLDSFTYLHNVLVWNKSPISATIFSLMWTSHSPCPSCPLCEGPPHSALALMAPTRSTPIRTCSNTPHQLALCGMPSSLFSGSHPALDHGDTSWNPTVAAHLSLSILMAWGLNCVGREEKGWSSKRVSSIWTS